jgi:uncharacterized membrane protein YgdD (TMEM256/DUF423 family)
MLMLLGVLLGAFGAHALKVRLTPEMLAVYQTGVQYHLAHALGLMLVGLVSQMQRNTQSGELPGSSSLKTAAILMGVGIVLFSGSLYALAISGVTILGAITPIGGLCFIAAWAMVAWHMLRSR